MKSFVSGVGAAAAAFLPDEYGNGTKEAVMEWSDAAEKMYTDYYPALHPVFMMIWDNAFLIALGVVLFYLHRWNSKVLIYNGGWHGAGRAPVVKRLHPEMLPPFANGWYKVLDSKDLPKGKVKSVRLCDKKLVAFRTETGKVGVLDAYCPHLGADLGMHGRVVDGCVECPFHAWKFNTNGECEGIEYSDCIPEGASIASYEVFEANNMIHVWYDAEKRPPHWYPHRYKETETGEWYFACWSGHEILTHMAEFPENGPDSAHLDVLHKDWIFSSALHQRQEKKVETEFISHAWEAEWNVDEEHPHQSNLRVAQKMVLGWGKWIPSLTVVPVKANQVGPALVYLHLQTSFGKILMAQNVTPVGKLRQRVEHFYYAEKTVPRLVAKFVAWGSSRQFERDVAIWESKTFCPRPLLTKGDGPITRFRQWFKQFYSENSVKFSDPTDNDW